MVHCAPTEGLGKNVRVLIEFHILCLRKLLARCPICILHCEHTTVILIFLNLSDISIVNCVFLRDQVVKVKNLCCSIDSLKGHSGVFCKELTMQWRINRHRVENEVFLLNISFDYRSISGLK